MFSVLVPVYKPEPEHLIECIQSVIDQTTSDWELCLVADGPQPADVDAILNWDDKRITVHRREENGGIIAASRDALAMATGEFIALLDNDDTLAPNALGSMAWFMTEYPNADVIYSDEDKLDSDGNRVDPFHKPAWSPERLRTQMYLGHLGVYRRSLVNEVGGFRDGFDGSQDHDLALRVTEVARSILHVPQVLYHWRAVETSTASSAGAKDWAFDAGVRAVQSHLERSGFPAVAKRSSTHPGVIDLEPALAEHPLVSIVMPTGGGERIVRGESVVLAEHAIKSVVARSTYPNYEVVVVLDRHSTTELEHRLLAVGQGRVKIVRDEKEFSFAGASNLGAIAGAGDILLFLNDDTEVHLDNWIERLVMYATRSGIGAVGAKLLYADGRIQHAGVWARDGGPGHRYPGYRGSHPGYMSALWLAQNCIAVTGACLAVERHKFESVGGFCTQFPLNFNDVDLCLKMSSAGHRTVVDCATTHTHLESSTRDPEVKDWEYYQLRDRWERFLQGDPWDNPHHIAHGVEEFPPPRVASTVLKEVLRENEYKARCLSRDARLLLPQN
jgi:GT2 family glycosyltransferase